MLREAIIPQVNDGKPFEALTATLQFDYQNCGTVSILYYRDGVQIEEPLIEGLDTVAGDLFVNLIKWQLAQALNPLVEVTKAVLDAMEKVPEAKYRIHLGRFTQSLSKANSSKGICFYHYKIYTDLDNVDIFEEESHKKLLLEVGNYIQADCPLALQVLLGFTTEGVPV
jgi:hypothetical protein